MFIGRRIITFCMLLINEPFVTNGIQPLLVQVLLPRLPFLFPPGPKPIDRRSILAHAVMAERRNWRCAVAVRAYEPIVIHCSFLRRCFESLRIRLHNINRIRLALGKLAQNCAHFARTCTDHKRRNQRHMPATFWANDFHTIEI